VQWSWSARNEETGAVAVTLWRDEFKRAGEGLLYERGPLDPDARVRPGHTELMGNLRWALDNADGRVRVIVAVAEDAAAKPRKIADCAPTEMLAYVRTLDEATGAFSIEAKLKA